MTALVTVLNSRAASFGINSSETYSKYFAVHEHNTGKNGEINFAFKGLPTISAGTSYILEMDVALRSSQGSGGATQFLIRTGNSGIHSAGKEALLTDNYLLSMMAGQGSSVWTIGATATSAMIADETLTPEAGGLAAVKLTAANASYSTPWNADSVTPNKMGHLKLVVGTDGVVNVTVSEEDRGVIYTGTSPSNGNTIVSGIQVYLGKYRNGFLFDNVEIYKAE